MTERRCDIVLAMAWTKMDNRSSKLVWILTLIYALALVNNPSVVCRDVSEPRGTISFNLSKQCLRWALLQIIKEIFWSEYEPMIWTIR